MVRYLRAGRVLTSALGGPFYIEPENLDPRARPYAEGSARLPTAMDAGRVTPPLRVFVD